MTQRFFPLDEALLLLPQTKYTPRLQEHVTRLGAQLPYKQAASEVAAFCHTDMGKSAARRTTQANGNACEARRATQLATLQPVEPETNSTPTVMQMSADGCFILLTTGQWHEVKTLAIGRVETVFDELSGQLGATTKELSYVSSRHSIRQFEEISTLEVVNRELGQAKTVLSLNDGSTWLQSLTDYHCPKAIRLLDLRHAQAYVADAGKAVFGEGSEKFKRWYVAASERLVNKPPQQTINRLRLLANQAPTEEARKIVKNASCYLEARLSQIDYRHFRQQPYPIGSGSVESAHKQIVQTRMKQAGMRWKLENVDGMLCLRNLLCNERWDSEWNHIMRYRIDQKRRQLACKMQPVVTASVTVDSVRTKPEKIDTLESIPDDKQHKPSAGHPWRMGIWPDPRLKH